VEKALETPDTQVRVFGKPETKVGRRMAVVLNAAESVEKARVQAEQAASAISIKYN
jgi:phosphoribosylglycinamide formyltransferase 2